MDTQKFWDRLRISPAHTALSRDPKICNDLLRRRDPPPRPLHAIGDLVRVLRTTKLPPLEKK